jgi:hypothetical protein
MPSKSKKQHNLMALVANDPKAAKRLGISKSVGEEFMKADKGKKFGSGGALKAVDSSDNPGLSKLPSEVRNKMGYMKLKPKNGGMAKKKPKKFNQKDVDDIFMQSEAEAQARFAANKAARDVAAQDYAKNRALEAAKDQQRRSLKKANMTGKEPPLREGRVNPYVMQEPGVSYRPLDHKDIMRSMGEFKKGGAVKSKPKASSASKRADGIATKGKTRGRMI